VLLYGAREAVRGGEGRVLQRSAMQRQAVRGATPPSRHYAEAQQESAREQKRARQRCEAESAVRAKPPAARMLLLFLYASSARPALCERVRHAAGEKIVQCGEWRGERGGG